MSPLQEALAKARDNMCVPQRGESCHGYGGIQCNQNCPAFQDGIERRRKQYELFLANKLTETPLPNGCMLRASIQGGFVLIEIGEYVDDGNTPIMFTVFERYILPRIVFDTLYLIPK